MIQTKRMGFIERLRQEEAAKALREQQRLRAQLEAEEKERLQRETAEKERRAQRRQQAERFREESGVGIAVAKLCEVLATPTIPIVHAGTASDWGQGPEYTEYVGRGNSSGPTSAGNLPISQKDSDSVFDIVLWDATSHNYAEAKRHGGFSHHSEKYIAVESCPDGTIVFHGGWFVSTTIRITEWRTNAKEQIFDKALEKAYTHPGVHGYSVRHVKSGGIGMG